MMNPLISIIVPIYNVEPYLCNSLDSIIVQTYSNLEIILVDDGSTDNCGLICDEYASRDSRIKVTHKKNEGVSAARNTGLMAASGEYIGWVDPDDWCEPDMFSTLLEGLMHENAQLALCGIDSVNGIMHTRIYAAARTTLSKEKALHLFCRGTNFIYEILTNKLIKKSLFDKITFPSVVRGEDSAVMMKLVAAAEKIVLLPEIKYYYYIRKGGLSQRKDPQSIANSLEILVERADKIVIEYPQLKNIVALSKMTYLHDSWKKMPCKMAFSAYEYQALQKMIALAICSHYDIRAHIGRFSLGRMELHFMCKGEWYSFLFSRFCQGLYEVKSMMKRSPGQTIIINERRKERKKNDLEREQ
jgi:glycosyltransferase involved in cell wall biosynthesis